MSTQLSLFDEVDETPRERPPLPIREVTVPKRAPRRDWFVLAQMVGCERAVVNAMIVGDVDGARDWLLLRARHREGLLSPEEFHVLYALAGEEDPGYTDWLKVEAPGA